ncbi:MAG TPA: metallophosphoesterase family protein [Pirellulaceae bacterium]
MRVAALFDIHGNLPALEAVLEDIQCGSFDRIMIGGDVVPGPMPRETLRCLRQLWLPVDYLTGNGDREVLARMQGVETEWYRTAPDVWRGPVRWSADQLGPDDAEWMAGWPAMQSLELPELGRVVFCHATPGSDTEVFTARTAEEQIMPAFEGVDGDLVICGHTHMQFDRKLRDLRIANAGSVGMPYGQRGAHWLQLGPGVHFQRTPYDFAAAASRIGATNYPQAVDFAARCVLQPPSESEMLEAFDRLKPSR